MDIKLNLKPGAINSAVIQGGFDFDCKTPPNFKKSCYCKMNNFKRKFAIERRGISRSRTAYKGPRLSTVKRDGTKASDHCAIFMDLEI